jgi:hypothetical protein
LSIKLVKGGHTKEVPMTAEATKPMKKAKKNTPPKTKVDPSRSPTVGMRKTRLMELAEGYGDSGMMNPRSIDPLVYMLAEMGEGVFGKSLIDHCQDEIALSNASFPRKRALGFLTDQIIRKYLAATFKTEGRSDTSHKLLRMPVLNDASYVDYFMTVSMMERDANRTVVAPVMGDLIKMVTGYETEQPAHVCNAIVNFFKVTKDQQGFEELLKGLCKLVKLTVR